MSKVPILKQRLNDLLSRGSVYSQSSSRIPKLDYTELVKRLKPEELGKDRGENGLPPLGYVGPDEVEQKINNLLVQSSENKNQSKLNNQINNRDKYTILVKYQ